MKTLAERLTEKCAWTARLWKTTGLQYEQGRADAFDEAQRMAAGAEAAERTRIALALLPLGPTLAEPRLGREVCWSQMVAAFPELGTAHNARMAELCGDK